jgi:hypothetical protein
LAGAGADVKAYRGMTLLMAGVTALLGIVMLVLTIARGGGIGLLIGSLFLAAGAGRIYLMRRN